MKNKIKSLVIVACSLFALTSCLDTEPVSSLTDQNMWKMKGTTLPLYVAYTLN